MFTDPPLAHVGLYEAEAKRLVEREGSAYFTGRARDEGREPGEGRE